MAKLFASLFSFSARGRLGKSLSLRRRGSVTIAEKKPEVPDQKTPAQLTQRLMWQQCTAFWNLLSDLEKKTWDSLARPQHMPGYALFMSSCLKPNPGIYLPLAGGTMTGNIAMAGAQTVDGVDISTHVLASTGVHGVGAKYIAESAVEDLDLATHKTRHQDGGDDEISLAALDGEPSTLTTHKALATGIHGVGAGTVGIMNVDKTIIDADTDTKIQVEEAADEDKIRMDVKGVEAFLLSDTGRLTLAKQSYFMARRTTTQSIPQTTWTKIQYNTEDVDIQGEYDPVTNFRFTAVEAGIYLVFISAGLTTPADGTRVILDAYKNGVACLRLCDITVGSATAFSPGGASGIINLAATDYVEAFIYQSGVAKNIAAADSANRFAVAKIA